ncbi:MAG: hypothetical protein HZC47_07055 [Methanobacterium sp.]|uniref:hypothetical protein n=1 Tax=Methanobacterium sp. TaxID=2164 RepID=UPI003D6606E5|nr:hypothetical protein [Methanobacterium sp.]
MNEKIMGIVYIIIALLIMVVYFAAQWFFVYLIWGIAIILLLLGVYMAFLKK